MVGCPTHIPVIYQGDSGSKAERSFDKAWRSVNAQYNSFPSFPHRVRMPKSLWSEQLKMENIAIRIRCFSYLHPLGGKRTDVIARSNTDSGSIDKSVYFEIDTDFDDSSFLNPIFL